MTYRSQLAEDAGHYRTPRAHQVTKENEMGHGFIRRGFLNPEFWDAMLESAHNLPYKNYREYADVRAMLQGCPL